ncbi:MAG: hypothetical protein AAF479_00280 [Pseudomonadota bacterium]
MSTSDRELAALREELESVPKNERLDYLANLPREQLERYRRLLPPTDRKKLNEHMDRLMKKRDTPTYESWLAEAVAGRASTTDAKMEALRVHVERLRPQDATWVRRIDETASAGGFTPKQAAVIEGIYARYFGSQAR